MLYELYQDIKSIDFRKNMEVLFTWRRFNSTINMDTSTRNSDLQSKSSPWKDFFQGNTASNGPSNVYPVDDDEVMEIRILKQSILDNGETETTTVKMLVLKHPGLARELLYQFMHPYDPVSPSAKASFACRFHTIMVGNMM